ncbi:YceI family protein [Lysobacter sp. F6437]|uniref:YceI family protein n=1 Tax=Lysobacter sp. F6437 TaxID=3459296 RepID=UPI00403DE5DD
MPFLSTHSSAARRGPLLAVALLLSLLSAPPAGASEPVAWKLDPVHTRVMFAVSHAGFSRAIGTVSGSDGGFLFDPGDWSGARLVVEVPLTRLDLGDADWNRAALAGNLLDADDFPTARFVSTTVTARDPEHARVCGDLTLHGVTRPLCMDVTVNAVERHPMPPFRLTAGFAATATLSRSDYGIDAWSSMIGDEVELRIEAEATRASRAFAERLLQAATNEAAPAPPAPETGSQPEPGPTP